jgi:hypothetical protein
MTEYIQNTKKIERKSRFYIVTSSVGVEVAVTSSVGVEVAVTSSGVVSGILPDSTSYSLAQTHVILGSVGCLSFDLICVSNHQLLAFSLKYSTHKSCHMASIFCEEVMAPLSFLKIAIHVSINCCTTSSVPYNFMVRDMAVLTSSCSVIL